MGAILVRRALMKDIPILKKFEQGVIQAERPFDITLKPDPITYYDLEELILSDDAALFIAHDNENIIASGYALIKKAKSYLNFEHYAYLGFMYVLPEYRGQGINSRIIDSIKEWCIIKNIHELKLEVYSENAFAIKAYQKAGFVPNLIEMRISI